MGREPLLPPVAPPPPPPPALLAGEAEAEAEGGAPGAVPGDAVIVALPDIAATALSDALLVEDAPTGSASEEEALAEAELVSGAETTAVKLGLELQLSIAEAVVEASMLLLTVADSVSEAERVADSLLEALSLLLPVGLTVRLALSELLHVTLGVSDGVREKEALSEPDRLTVDEGLKLLPVLKVVEEVGVREGVTLALELPLPLWLAVTETVELPLLL